MFTTLTVVLFIVLCFTFLDFAVRFASIYRRPTSGSSRTVILTFEGVVDVAALVSILGLHFTNFRLDHTNSHTTKRMVSRFLRHYLGSRDVVWDVVALAPLQLADEHFGRFNRIALLLRYSTSCMPEITRVLGVHGTAETVLPLLLSIFASWLVTIAIVMFLFSHDWDGTATWQKHRDGWDSYESPFHVFVHSANLALNWIFASPNVQYPRTDTQLGAALAGHMLGIFVKSTVLALASSIIAQRSSAQEELRQKLD
eukprot:PhM_4_TR2104/c0_g1_i1/m.6374